MGRVINPDSTGKTRNRLMRTCAEVLRHLSQKTAIDEEAKDMAACLVFSLREIEQGIEDSAAVWEKRDYWMKAEQLRQRWGWVGNAAAQIENLIRTDHWDGLPDLMMKLLPRFSDIKVTRVTRSSKQWDGAYEKLHAELR